MRATIYQIVENIKPYDAVEEAHIFETLEWIGSGAEIFRVQKPDVPNKHLVAYFVIVDLLNQKILLVKHKKAGLWLPPGGHIEINEHPKVTVERECLEELNVLANFWLKDPIFITSTPTVGLTAGHIDVSLWYVLNGHYREKYVFDKEEFEEIRWFNFDQIPYKQSDPHMKRFVQKFRGLLSALNHSNSYT